MMIVKIKDKDGVIQTEINNISVFEINQVLNDEGLSSFTIAVDNNEALFENFKESNRFEYYEEQDLIFEGFFAGIEATLNTIKVSVSDVGLFKKKIILVDKNYTASTSICSILQEILDEINARDDTGFTLECFTSQTIAEEVNYSLGTNYFEILQDLSNSGFEFKIADNKISFLDTIGIDRTQNNEDYFQFFYNQKSPEGNNVESVDTIIPSRIFNAITVKDFQGNTITVTDATSISSFGRLEKVITSDGDLTKTANEELARTKDSTKDITINPTLENFSDVGLGDSCDSDIISFNDLLNFSGTVKILEKNLTSGEKQTFSVKISSTENKVLNFLQRFQGLERSVNKLLIQ